MINLKDELSIYIKENYIDERKIHSRMSFSDFAFADFEMCDASIIDKYINDNKELNDFQTLLFKYIDERNLKDSDVYNKVHIDRRLFSKIRSDKEYHPSKETILLLGFSLELNEKEIEKLLDSASYSLPKNNYYDLIIRFCFVKGIYKISNINNLLDEYNCKLFNF